MPNVIVPKRDWPTAVEERDTFYIDAADKHEFDHIHRSRWNRNQEPERELIEGRRAILCVQRDS